MKDAPTARGGRAATSVRARFTPFGDTAVMAEVAGLVADGPQSELHTFAARSYVLRSRGAFIPSPWAFSVVPAVSPSTLRALYGELDDLAERARADGGDYAVPQAGSRYVLPRLHGRVDCEQTVPIDVEDGAAVYEVSTRSGSNGEPWRELLSTCHIDPDGGEPFTQKLDEGDAVPGNAFYGWVAEHAEVVRNMRG